MQPDTITPGGPQGLNRYSYTLNNPIRYNDPTGHAVSCETDENCKEVRRTAKLGFDEAYDEAFSTFGVKLTNGTSKWDQRDKIAALMAVTDVARKMGADSGRYSVDAFRTAFDTYDQALELRKMEYYEYVNSQTGKTEKGYDGGLTVNSHLIYITRLSQPIGRRSGSLALAIARNNIVHEFGHAFADSNPSVGNNIPAGLITDEGWPLRVDGGFLSVETTPMQLG